VQTTAFNMVRGLGAFKEFSRNSEAKGYALKHLTRFGRIYRLTPN